MPILDTAEIKISTSYDDKGTQKAADSMGKLGTEAKKMSVDWQKMSQSMIITGTMMTAAVTLPVVGGFYKMIQASSENEEAMNKFNVVMGDSAKEVEAWVDEVRSGMLSSRTDIIKNLSSFQDLLVPLGMNRKEASKLAKTYVTLAEDVSSFNNVPVQEVQEAIQSAMTGMYRPMKQYGVVIDEARIKSKALEMGLTTQGEELDLVSKQLVIQQMILDGTADAQGDVERSSGSLANQMKFLKRDVEDLTNDMGDLLMPIVQKMIKSIRGAVDWFRNLSIEQKETILKVGALAASIGPLLIVFGTLIKSVLLIKGAFVGLSTFIGAGGIGLVGIIAGLTAVVAAGIYMWNAYNEAVKQTEYDTRLLGEQEDVLTQANITMTDSVRELSFAQGELRNKEDELKTSQDELINIGNDLNNSIITTGENSEATQSLREAYRLKEEEVRAKLAEVEERQSAVNDETAKFEDAKTTAVKAIDEYNKKLGELGDFLTKVKDKTGPAWDALRSITPGIEGFSQEEFVKKFKKGELQAPSPSVLYTKPEVSYPWAPKNAEGTDNWKGGGTWVGEKGPEWVNLPRGSQIIPNNKSSGITINQQNYINNQTDPIAIARGIGFELARAR